MALNFPSSPVDGQTYNHNGAYYTYNATIGAWTAMSGGNAGGSANTEILFNNQNSISGNSGMVFDVDSNTASFDNVVVTKNVSAAYYTGNGALLTGIVTDFSPAFNKANAANVLAFNTGIGANAWSNAVGTAGNSYTDSVGTAANTTANGQFTAVNSYIGLVTGNINSYVALATANANNYAGAMANAANAYAASLTPDLSPAFNRANTAWDKANSAPVNAFVTIQVSGQSNVNATTNADSVTFKTDGTINITTDASTKAVTLAIANTDDYGLITGSLTLTNDYGSIA